MKFLERTFDATKSESKGFGNFSFTFRGVLDNTPKWMILDSRKQSLNSSLNSLDKQINQLSKIVPSNMVRIRSL